MANQSDKSIYTLGVTLDGYIQYAQNLKPGCYLWDVNCLGFNNQTFSKMLGFLTNNTIEN